MPVLPANRFPRLIEGEGSQFTVHSEPAPDTPSPTVANCEPTDLQAQAFAWLADHPDGTQSELRTALGISKGYANRLWHEYHEGDA